MQRKAAISFYGREEFIVIADLFQIMGERGLLHDGQLVVGLDGSRCNLMQNPELIYKDLCQRSGSFSRKA
jgi:hypothetical protein